MVVTVLLSMSLIIGGCDGVTDDLKPSGTDKRPLVEEGTIGTQVGQQAPDFSMLDTLGNSRGLYDELSRASGVVLYFNMWCPICDAHASHMRTDIIPEFPDVQFFLVDYVTGSVSNSRSAQLSNGYTDMDVLVDADQAVFDSYNASMGTTIVIDKDGIVHMNEDYKDGDKLAQTLRVLP
jgi:peroxiredoxin